jgi:hypothetical protein
MVVMESARTDAKDLFVRATDATERLIEGINPTSGRTRPLVRSGTSVRW